MRVGRIPQVLVVLVVLLGAATPMIAPVLAQENNSTSAGGNDTGSGVVNDVNSSDPAGANTSGTNNTSSNSSLGGPYGNASSSGQTASGSSSSGSQGEEAYGSGYLYDVTNNASAGPNGSVQYANNSSANGSAANGSEMNGSGLNSDADGVKGTAINAALDVVARILKFISNSIGAALTFILKKVIGAMTWTPHPPRGNTYQAATNMGDSTFWGQQYKTYSEIWQPFTLVLCGVLTGVYVLGSREVLDILPAQVQENGWLHLGIAWIMTTDTSWVIVSVILEPGPSAAQAKAVTPAVHVRHDPTLADSGQFGGQQDLQIAHGIFLIMIAAGVGMQAGPAFRRHAEKVTGLVQHRMYRCICPQIQPALDQPGFRFAPERAWNIGFIGHWVDLQLAPPQQGPDLGLGRLAPAQHCRRLSRAGLRG